MYRPGNARGVLVVVPPAAAPLRGLPRRQAVAQNGPHPTLELSRGPQCEPSSFSPAVLPACHKQRSPAVSSGQSRSLRGGHWAGRTCLTWGRRGGRNCMACKGSEPFWRTDAIAGAASRDRADLVVRPWLQPGRVTVGSSASRRSTLRTMGPTGAVAFSRLTACRSWCVNPDQITGPSSSNATATRRLTGASEPVNLGETHQPGNC